MKKILVPIDNSKISKGAVMYAINLAESLGGEIILLSVINASNSSGTLISWRVIEQQMVSKDEENVQKMIREVQEITGTRTKITHKYELGFPVHELINRFVSDNDIDLVVMGTGGARGLKKVLAGSRAASVIDTCRVPVLTIPKTASAGRIKRIVFATDLKHLDKEIKAIAGFAKPFDADIEIVHLIPEGQRDRDWTDLEQILIRMTKYRKIHLRVLKGVGVAKNLRAFAAKYKADMIVMFTHELGFFEKLLGKGNTRQVAFEGTVPLLAFNRTNSQL